MKYDELEIVSGSIYKTYFKFTFPNMIGLIAMSSVSLVDGYFVSRYVSSVALAAVNIIIPLITVVFGISIMLTIGAAVLIGKYLGERKEDKAAAVFTKVIITITVMSLFFTAYCFIFSENVSRLLGANDEIMVYAVPYLKMVSIFFLFQSLEYCLSVMIRTDGNPYLASTAVLFGAVLNFILDYIFIVHMNMGISGAALGTGLSFMASTFLILLHFFFKKGRLYLTCRIGKWKEIIYASYNGSSNIMVQRLGTYGVEAFTVINYALWAANMLCYAVGDSLVPLISINFGALKYTRIQKIISLSRISVIFIGLFVFALFTFIPEKIIATFLNPVSDKDAFDTALIFADYVKYAFLFIGLNIIFSSSFTAFQKPLHSVAVAVSRGLMLPVAFILIMPLFLGEKGIYAAVPLAEAVTTILGFILWRNTLVIKQVMGR